MSWLTSYFTHVLQELDGKTENSSNGSLLKPQVEHAGQNPADLQRETPALFVKSPANGDGGAYNGGDVGHSEAEYIEFENLNDVEDVDLTLKDRGRMIPLIVETLKNPSAVCKTALRTSSNIFKAYGDDIIDSMDPLINNLSVRQQRKLLWL